MGALNEWVNRGPLTCFTMVISRNEAEDYLYREAAILDQREYDRWLTLFTDDGIYWLPMEDDGDPHLQSSILYDDTKMRAMRVHQILRKSHYAQMPKSRTVHSISNVIVEAINYDDETEVNCVLNVTEVREGNYQQLGLGNQRTFAGHAKYRLRREADRLAIALKKVTLVNRDMPIENLSFII